MQNITAYNNFLKNVVHKNIKVIKLEHCNSKNIINIIGSVLSIIDALPPSLSGNSIL